MKYFLFLFFFSSAITFGFAQSNTTIELKQYMDSHLDELIPIRIEFIKNVDCYNLNEKFKAQNTTLDKRVKKVNEVLINQSYESQHQILDFFKSKNIPNSNIKSFWIVNIIVANCPKKCNNMHFLFLCKRSRSSILSPGTRRRRA